MSTRVTRRHFLHSAGAIIVAFNWPLPLGSDQPPVQGGRRAREADAGTPPSDQLDSWLAIDATGIVTLFSGKVELGTGVQTALSQIVAEELDVPVGRVRVIQGETGRTPNQGMTVGSKTLQSGGVQIRRAAAEARQALIELASTRLGVPAAQLLTADGSVHVQGAADRRARAGATSVPYGDLIGTQRFNRQVTDRVAVKPPARYSIVGKPVPRVDLPAKVAGTHEYVHNVRVPGMLHGRVVRPTILGATLTAIDEASVRALPGIIKIVRRGNFVGIIADREEQAIAAARELKLTWTPPATALPDANTLDAVIRATPATERVLANEGDVVSMLPSASAAATPTAVAAAAPTVATTATTAATRTAAVAGTAATPAAATSLSAASAGSAVSSTRSVSSIGPRLEVSYSMPFQSHGSIGPSCAVADVREQEATVWSGTQGSYALRDAIADLLAMPADRVRVIWTEASGCYGHNGADDVAADAAVLSREVGKPVRVQWMRHDEHAWDPKGPAMLMDIRAALGDPGGADRGKIVAWDYTVFTTTHATRPGGNASNLLAAQLMGQPLRLGTVGGDRNARTSYVLPNHRTTVRWLQQSVLRPSAFRGLGAPANLFAIESFIDELAAAARVDPVQFRLNHLQDPRALAVIRRVAELARWRPHAATAAATGGTTAANAPVAPVRGRGVSFLQYENANTYVATIVEVDVTPATGAVRVTRLFVAHDCGLVVNPDGVRNQIEGGAIQAISRTLKEQVQWDRQAVTSVDWQSYPILTFTDAPDAIEVALIDHPELPALGAGEAAHCGLSAAIGNAIFDATGVRLRALPFTPDRVKAALERSRAKS